MDQNRIVIDPEVQIPVIRLAPRHPGMMDEAQSEAPSRDRVVFRNQVAEHVVEGILRVHPKGHQEIARPEFQVSPVTLFSATCGRNESNQCLRNKGSLFLLKMFCTSKLRRTFSKERGGRWLVLIRP